MPIKIEKKQGHAHSSVEDTKTGEIKDYDEKVPLSTGKVAEEGPDKVTHAPYRVNVSAHMTINQGNYNSIKVGVSLTAPSSFQELDEVFEFCEKWVDEKLNRLVADDD